MNEAIALIPMAPLVVVAIFLLSSIYDKTTLKLLPSRSLRTFDAGDDACRFGNTAGTGINSTRNAISLRLAADIDTVHKDCWRPPPRQVVRRIWTQNIDFLIAAYPAIGKRLFQVSSRSICQGAAVKGEKLDIHVTHLCSSPDSVPDRPISKV